MSLPLFYAFPDEIDAGKGTVMLKGPEAIHLARSLRAKEGESVLIGDRAGGVYLVRLTLVGTEHFEGSIQSFSHREPETPKLVLMQAVSRAAKMDEAIARAAESGVSLVIPFVSPRSPEGSREKAWARLDRWRKIALESSKVARRAWPLAVGEPLPWLIDKDSLSRRDVDILLWEGETSNVLAELMPKRTPQCIGIIVGPEGGFAVEEAAQLTSAGAVAASMGELILRTESAGSYVAMLIRYQYGLLQASGERYGE
jgi:16S rRNA (uracil1498-N3)-methyltransferase